MVQVIASLPMYDRPELREATDRLWAHLAAALRRAGVEERPVRLTRALRHTEAWGDHRLLFSQACGYDVFFRFADRLIPIAAPRYRAEGCEGITYRSTIVVRADEPVRSIADLRGRRAAFNEPSSHSGRVALAAVVAEHAVEGRFFAGSIATGSHEGSAEAVAEGRADVAALDCTSWSLIRRARSDLDAALRILAMSAPCPAPPFVVGSAVEAPTRRVLVEALSAIESAPELVDVREALLLDGVEPIEPAAYAACGALAERARRFGYDLLDDKD